MGLSDEQWLLQRLPQATLTEKERFRERVSIIVEHPNPGFHALMRARSLALEAITHDYGPLRKHHGST